MLEFFWSLVVGGVLGMVAAAILGRDVPGGFFGSVVVGLMGSWLGRILLGQRGPEIGGVFLVPSLIGAALCIMLSSYLITKLREYAYREGE